VRFYFLPYLISVVIKSVFGCDVYDICIGCLVNANDIILLPQRMSTSVLIKVLILTLISYQTIRFIFVAKLNDKTKDCHLFTYVWVPLRFLRISI